MRHADRQPQNRLFIQQCVENAGRAELLLQPLRHAIDAALARDILTKNGCVGILQHDVGERKINAFCQCDRLSQITRVLGKHNISLCRLRRGRRGLRTFLWFNRGHYLSNSRQTRLGQCIKRYPLHPCAHIFIAGYYLHTRHTSLFMQNARAVQQRVLRLGGFNLRHGSIA